jgi:hypothetical protein
MIPALLFAALNGPLTPAEPPRRLTLSPLFVQNAVLFTSDRVTAGGAGGGVGLELELDRRFLAQADVEVLLTLGNTVMSRVALGAQRPGTWSPAAFGTFGALFGDRVEFLTGDGRRPPIPTWALGLRVAALRFRLREGTVSLVEAGAGTDFGGGLWLELTIIQAGVRF